MKLGKLSFVRATLGLALACLTLGAEGAAWFDAGISGYLDWPDDNSVKVVPGAGMWSNTEGALLRGEEEARYILLETAEQTPLEFTVVQSHAVSEGEIALSADILFTPGVIPAPDQTLKGALTVVTNEETNAYGYYGLVKDPAGTTNIWTALSGVTPDSENSVNLTILFREQAGVRQVQYRINGTPLELDSETWLPIVFAGDSDDVTAVGFLGSGQLNALSGAIEITVENTVLTIPALTNLTVTAVKANGITLTPQADGTYLVPKGATVSVSFAAPAGKYLDRTTMVFTMDDSMTLPTDGRPQIVSPSTFLSINEVMASNGDTLATAGGAYLDWIEIRNTSDSDVDISGWYVYDDPEKKKSKWETIQGPCVVPANGYKVIFLDKDYLGFTADEAYARVNLSSDGEQVFLATPEDGEIVDLVTFGFQLKDVSIGRGKMEHVLRDASAPAEWRVGDGEWQAVNGPVGMSAAAEGFKVVTYQFNTSISSVTAAESAIADTSLWSANPVTNICKTLAFNDGTGSTTSTFTYSDFPGLSSSANNFALVITGTVMIPRAGQWTFSGGSDDGFRAVFSRGGISWSVEYTTTRSYGCETATFSFPEAGAYDFRMIYFDCTGGATCDFAVAEGEKNWTDNASDFHVVGTDEAGLEVGGAYDALIAADVTDAMLNKSASLDWRGTFERSATSAADTFRLRIRAADGFQAKLNGVLFASAPASTEVDSETALTYAYYDIPAALVAVGTNTLEVTGLNASSTNEEFFLSPEVLCQSPSDDFLYFKKATPNKVNSEGGYNGPTPEVTFSVPHGWKTETFTVELSCPDNPDAVIYYTTNGVSPTTSSFRYTGPITIDHTTCIRANAPVADSVFTRDTSATYLFVSDVMTQSGVPANFPASKAINSQVMSYGMNTTIVGSYAAHIAKGFTNQIDTVSLVIDPECLFNKSTGIYVNATGNGRDWERPLQLELICPTNSAKGFSVPAGIRIRGAFSRGSSYPKHSFRCFFRNEYGMSKLSYKLFDKEDAADTFDKIDFRTAQNYSWANGNNKFTFIEECFSRDSQRDMGQPAHKSRYYNLFINGTYWGVYQTEERSSQDHGANTFGGNAEDYDVYRTSQPGYTTSIVEGETTGMNNFWNMSVNEGYGSSYPNNYKKAMGLNPDGTRNTAYPIYLNPTNVIVYTLTSNFANDSDSPADSGSSKANNVAALWNRHSGTNTVSGVKQLGWIWNRHDAEHSLGTNGKAVSEDYLSHGTELASSNMKLEKNFNPNELSYKLLDNIEYKILLADIFFKECLKETGAMVSANAQARFRARMDEMGDAIACEAARWGGGSRTPATWTNACNTILTWIDARMPYMLTQYRSRGWYPSVDAPRVTLPNGEHVFDGHVFTCGDTLYLADESAGTIYYTTNGVDPRVEGGAVSAEAITYAGTAPGLTYSTAFAKKSEWQYYDYGSQPAADSAGRAWYAKDYANTSTWGSGNGILGFNGSTATETIGTTLYKYVNHGSSGTQVCTYYFRKTFTLPAEAATSTDIKLNILYDDCYAVYINGTEVDRLYLASGADYSTVSTSGTAHKEEITRSLTIPAGLLREGANTIAVEVHQNQMASSDIYFDLGLEYGVYSGGSGALVVPTTGAKIRARLLSSSGEWSALESVDLPATEASEESKIANGLRLAEVMSSTADEDGDGHEFLVLTNLLSDATLHLGGVRITCTKTGNAAASLDLTLPSDLELAPGASLTLTKAAYWPGDDVSTPKITNGKVDILVYDDLGAIVQTAHVEASWWSKACDGTGAHFIALEFGTEVTEETQWKPSFTPPENEDGAKGIAKACEKDDAVRAWLDEQAKTEAGAAAIAAFASGKGTVRTCYLVDIPLTNDPQVELLIPSIILGDDGTVTLGGTLSIAGEETERTVNGAVNLYYAPTLEELPTSTNSVPLDTTFPLAPRAIGLPEAAARFFQLKIE